MKIDMNGMIYALSYALDCIEGEIKGVSREHAKWVAFLSTIMGKKYGMSKETLQDLSACAALHDNALTQYLLEEGSTDKKSFGGLHCKIGEDNIREFPFAHDISGFVLYHHENADGSGPYGRSLEHTPLEAQIIHLADMVDVRCHVGEISVSQYEAMKTYLTESAGTLFAGELVTDFLTAVSLPVYLSWEGKHIDTLLHEELPHKAEEVDFEQVKKVIDVFGKIIDYKSVFTRNHSEQIAKRALKLARVYGYDEKTQERLYVAGTLHDIGKMAVSNDILEKPGKLTDSEFVEMKNHAYYSYEILSKIQGFEDITEWASYHHEKLNGKGYPFGKTAEELSEKDRLMACVDIYQALREDRPYKPGFPHEKCMEIMRKMVQDGYIDGSITERIDTVFA